MVNENMKEKPSNNLENEQVYRMIKCPLKSVLKEYDKLQPIIDDVVKDINKFVILCYQFIRLYLLDKFNTNKEFPTINKSFILDVLKTIATSETNRGKSNKDENIKNKSIKDDIKLFYDNVFSKLVNEKLSYTNKTHILEQTAKEMITCLETNISTHFIKHLFRYINCLYKDPKTKQIKLEKDKEKRKVMYKELNEEIRNLKSDLINNKIVDSKSEYHDWINKTKKYLYPEKITKTIAYDVKIHPEKYLIHAFYINSKIEKLGCKSFQVIPQRNNIVPKNIVLNTSGIADYIGNKYPKLFDYPKSELVLHCKQYQKHIWSKILKLEKRSIFNNEEYVFYNQITTNGFSCCLLFILKKYKDKEYGDKLPKCIQDECDIKNVNSLTKDECNKYLMDEYKLVSVDPGKIRPISMIDENNNFYKYSACRRRFETYTKRCNEIINTEKIKHNIIEKETKLSKFNSKTLKIEEYKKYITNKNKLNNQVKPFYNNILFRKLNFRRFVRTKQSEENLLNEIENKFLTKDDKINNKKILLLYGDYSRTSQMKGTISAPNIGFKKLLLKRFEILEVNEYNTSKLYNKTFKELENVSVRKNKHKKHLHEILTPKEETERCIFVNRDKNACKNILYLGKYFLRNQSRPIEFCQKTKEKIVVKQRKPRQNLKTSEFLNNDDKKSKILLSQKKEIVV
jgi:hypothetical protein